MKTAVIYARYSCDAQTEQSIEGQLRVCEDYAKSHDILILDTYIDRAMTGTNDQRPDFRRMIKDSAKRQWDYVLVYKQDRFSRDKYEATMHKHTLKVNGVKVLSAMENIPDTPEGIILEALLEGMNQYYSADLAQKVMRGMRENRLKGYFSGGTLPYGYFVSDKKVFIDEDKAEVVRYIFTQYEKGVFVKDIIAALTAKGILYKGKPFFPNTIYGIIKNEKYSGSYRLRDEIVDKVFPPIISHELYAKVRAKTEANKYGKRSTDVVYLLRQKMKCGYCGESLIAECGTSKTGDRRYYYKCNGRKSRRNSCTQSAYRKEILENFIISSIVTELKKPEQMERIIDGLLALQDAQLKANPALTILEKEQRQNQTAIDNIMVAVEQGLYTATAGKRMRQLEERQTELERLILIEHSKQQVRITAQEIRSYYTTALKSEPQMLVNYLVKEVIVYDDAIHIYFNSPLQTSPEDSQGFSICDRSSFIPTPLTNTRKLGSKKICLRIIV